MNKLVIKIMLSFGLIVGFHTTLNANEIKISPKFGASFSSVVYEAENGQDMLRENMIGLNFGLDLLNKNYLIGVNYENVLNHKDRALSLTGLVYKYDLNNSKFNYGLGLEWGRVGWNLNNDFVQYLSPKVSFIIDNSFSLDIKKREHNYIISVSYSF